MVRPIGRNHRKVTNRIFYPAVKIMKFFYVYILKSINYDFIYVGQTDDLRRRFKEHNNKIELSIKHYAPYSLIHYEAYRNKKDAKRREEYFKTTKGKTTLRTMLKVYFAKEKEKVQSPVSSGTGSS